MAQPHFNPESFTGQTNQNQDITSLTLVQQVYSGIQAGAGGLQSAILEATRIYAQMSNAENSTSGLHYVSLDGEDNVAAAQRRAREQGAPDQRARELQARLPERQREAFTQAIRGLDQADQGAFIDTFLRLTEQQGDRFLQLSREQQRAFVAMEGRISSQGAFTDEQIRSFNLGNLTPLEASLMRSAPSDQDRTNLRNMALALIADPTQMRAQMNELRRNSSVEQMMRTMCQLGSALQGTGLQTFVMPSRNEDGITEVARMGIGVAGQNQYMLLSSDTQQRPVLVQHTPGRISVIQNDSSALVNQLRQRFTGP